MGHSTKTASNGHRFEALSLQLTCRDSDVIAELLQHEEGPVRHDFALDALKIGVLSIRQAGNVIDAKECERFLESVGQQLTSHAAAMNDSVGKLLGRYFDPGSGELHQRLDKLVRGGGELEALLGRHLNGDGSVLTKTLEKHLGAGSVLLQTLSPDQRKGFLATLKESLDAALGQHRTVIAKQFSMDDPESGLSRLVREISEKNGGLRRDLARDIDAVRKEFSLDNEAGALARLVGRVEKTQRAVNANLSLDREQSPLSRLRRELMTVIEAMGKANADHQEQVRVTLESMQVRRAEAARSTRHGLAFQDTVGQFLQQEAQRLGDMMFESVKDTVGAVARCKIGDFTLTLGPESAAPDARIVYEAKEERGVTLKAALAELARARENRRAGVGVFVFSRETAPEGIEPLSRWDRDIVVVWDAADPLTDVMFKAAVSVARCIAVHDRRAAEETTVGVAEMQTAIEALCRDAGVLDDIIRCASAVQSNGEKIASQAGRIKKRMTASLDDLQRHVLGLAGRGS